MRSLLRTEAGDFGLYAVFRAYALQKPRPSGEQGELQQQKKFRSDVISDTLWLMQICSGLGSVESIIEDEALWGALESDPAQGIGVLNWLLWNVGYDGYSLLETTSLEAGARTGSGTGSCGADTAMLMKRLTDAGGSPKKYASTASIAEDLRVSERAKIVVKKCLACLDQLGLQRFGELSAATQVDIRETLQSACKVLRKCVAIENTARIRHDVDAATAAALFRDKHVWEDRLELLNCLSRLVSLPGRAFWQIFAVSNCSTGSEGEEENGSTSSSSVAKSASEAYAELLDVVTALLRVDHAQLPSPSHHFRAALNDNTHRFCEELEKIFVETAHREDETVFRKFLPFLVEWRGDQGFLELWVEGRGWRRSAMLLHETLHFVLQDLMVVGGPGAEAALQREADNLVYQLVASGGSGGGDAGDRSPTSSGVEADEVDGSRQGSDDGESEPDETDDQQATSYRPIDLKHLVILLDADLINILSEETEWYSGTPPGLVPQIAGAQLDAWLEKAAAQQQLQGECAAAVGFLITQLLYFATGMIVPESRALLSDAENDARLQAGATWRGNESVVLHTLQALKQGLVRRPDLLSSAGATSMLLDYQEPQSIAWRVLDPSGSFTTHGLLCQALFEVLLLLDAGVAHQVLQEPRFQNQIKVKHIKAAADAYRALFEANAIDLEQGECLERLRLWEGMWRELQTHRRRAPRDTVAPAPPAANGSSGVGLRLCSPPEQALEWTCGSEVLVPVLQAQTLLCVRVLQKGARECRGREAEGAVLEQLLRAPELNMSTVEDVHAWAQHPSNQPALQQLLARAREEKSRAFWRGAAGEDGPLWSVWENVCSVLYHHRKDDDADAAGALLHCLVDSVVDLPGEFVRDWMRLQLVEGHRYHQHHSGAPQIAPAHTYGLEKLMTRLLRNANAQKLYGAETSVQSLCVAVFVIEALKSGTCSTAIAPLRKNPKDRRRQRVDALRLLIEKKQGCGTVEDRRKAVEELMVFERTIDAREMPRIAQTVRWCKRKIEEMNAVEAASTSAVLGRPQ
eukprot:g358.t1